MVLLQGTYVFEDSKGVSGVLFPDGAFKKCGNGQHHYLLEEIKLEEQYRCLYFSSTMKYGGDGLITHSPVQFSGLTDEQILWMTANFDFFDRGQQRRASFDFQIQSS